MKKRVNRLVLSYSILTALALEAALHDFFCDRSNDAMGL